MKKQERLSARLRSSSIELHGAAPFAGYQPKVLREFLLQLGDNLQRAVCTFAVGDKNFKTAVERRQASDHALDMGLLVVGRNNDGDGDHRKAPRQGAGSAISFRAEISNTDSSRPL